MHRIDRERDIRPLSAFRANAAPFIKKLQETGRPVLLTQHGHTVVIVLHVRVYERLMDEIEILRDVKASEVELDAGGGVSHEESVARICSQYGSYRC